VLVLDASLICPACPDCARSSAIQLTAVNCSTQAFHSADFSALITISKTRS